MALALEYYRSAPKYLGARTIGSKVPGLVTAGLAPLRLVTQKDPEPVREGWARVKPHLSGICGSDLSTTTAPRAHRLSSRDTRSSVSSWTGAAT